MTNPLPPKTCSIDRLITVSDDIELVMQGKKTSTRRNGRYADPGEIMELKGRQFEVYDVFTQSIGELTDEDAQSEGFADVEDYKQYILSMHKGMSLKPEMKMWVHKFRPVQ